MSSESFRPRRRELLAGSAGTLLASGLASGGLATPAYADPNDPSGEVKVFTSDGVRPTAADYAGLRASWRTMLLGKDVDPGDERFAAAIAALDTEAAGYRALLDARPDRDRVFTDQPFDPPSGISQTFVRTARIATAWATPGSALYQNADVVAELVAGLRTTYDLVYNERQAEYGNWWEWEIGSPRNLTDALILLYDHVAPEDLALYCGTIDHFVPDPFYMFPPERRIVSTGANRVDLCRAVAVRGILGQTDERIGRARDGLSDIFAYVTSGDGFYRDGSFVQHGTVAYTGTYGIELIDGMSKLIALLAGSAWEVDDPNREVLFRAIEITFAPVIYSNQMLDFVRGRAISRTQRRDHHDGHSAVEHILKLAEGVAVEDATRAARWRAICKGWLTRDSYDDPFAGARVPRVSAYAGVLDDAAVPAAPEPNGFTIFASMDRVIHRRPGWAYGISMSSKRISYYECGNGENNTGYHTGEGMTYLYLASDNGQWADSYWPTTDYGRMPGTTIDTKPLPPQAGGTFGAARPKVVTWVGGASLDGEFGAVGQDLEGMLAPLTGRKSWFCLDDYVVALGAGITDTSGFAAVTTVENRNLHADGASRLLLDGLPQPVEQGWNVSGRRVRWAHLDGVAGYVFPGKASLSAVREERTGSWRDINTGGPTTPITRRWLTLWLDHGVDPVDAGYAYVVAPKASVRRTRELADRGDVRILANTAQAQAIWVPRLGVVAVSFWAPGQLGDLTVDAPCSLVLRERHGRLTVAVADPTHLQAAVNVSLTRRGYRAADSDPTIEVVSVRPEIRFTVHSAGTFGVTQTARFRR